MSTVLGIDVVQWRALVRAGLRTDLRTSGRALMFSSRPANTGASVMAAMLLLYAFLGVAVAPVVALASDRLFSATLFLTMLALFLGSSLLIEYQAVVLSPADFRQLAFRPVTSRTFFAARLTSVCIYTLVLAAAFTLGPFFAFAFGRAGSPVVALTAVAAAAFEVVTVSLAVIAVYMSVLRFVPAARLTSALSYLQLTFSFLLYGMLILGPQVSESDALLQASLPRSWWLLLNPASWFAGWITIAAGEGTSWDAVAASASVAAFLFFGWLVMGRLSIDYAERLAESSEAASHDARSDAGRPLARGRFPGDGEARAVALLLRAHFRYDQQFRLTVLSIVPLTVVYLLAGGGSSSLDPFDPQGGEALVYLAVMLFPSLMRMAMSHSHHYRAAWIFHGTQADKPALVLAVRRLLMVYFVLPYLAALGLVFMLVTGRIAGMILHTGVLVLISHLVLAIDILLNPDIPFSLPPVRGRRVVATMTSIFIIIVAGLFLQFGLRAAYASVPGTLALVAVLVGLNAVAEMGLHARLRSLSAHAEFDV
ncbi:MAG TPA: hypothetical protein VIL35_12360 [Vicinamibacterales bacterium]